MKAGERSHIPVMFEQALDYLNCRPGRVYVDATAGYGGHLEGIIRQAGTGKIIAIDRDAQSLNRLATRFGSNATFACANFSRIEEVLASAGLDIVDGGILADLGVSSMQLDDPARGFSFLADGPLDMRMDGEADLTAADIVNTWSEHDLANIIYRYGEEKESRKIARAIVKSRPLHTTSQLAGLVCRCLRAAGTGRDARNYRLHPATRTFQAIRMAVNNELDSLEKFLRSSLKLLAPGARLVVITFHSLEDRLVKHFFRQAASTCLCPPRQPVCTCHHKKELLIITRKAVVPLEKEVLANPRSRSAKLRAGEKV